MHIYVHVYTTASSVGKDCVVLSNDSLLQLTAKKKKTLFCIFTVYQKGYYCDIHIFPHCRKKGESYFLHTYQAT